MAGFAGRCACGAVTWVAQGPTTRNLICHCESCQRATSSGFTAFLGLLVDDLHWSGPVQHFESSPGTRRGFCGACGTRLYFRSDLFPDETHVHAATLEDPGQYKPDAQVWVSEARSWVSITDDLKKYVGFQRDTTAGKEEPSTC